MSPHFTSDDFAALRDADARLEAECLALARKVFARQFGRSTSALDLAPCCSAVAFRIQQAECAGASDAELEAAIRDECRKQVSKLVGQMNVFVHGFLNDRGQLMKAAGLDRALDRLVISEEKRLGVVDELLREIATQPEGYATTDDPGASFESWLRGAVRALLPRLLRKPEGHPGLTVFQSTPDHG